MGTLEIEMQDNPLDNLKWEFMKFKNKHKLSLHDLGLLVEAYRRRMMFNQEKPLEQSWLGLGTPYYYKSKLFIPLNGATTPRVNNWFLLSKKGIEIFSELIKDFPFPTQEKQNELNSFLCKIRL